MMAMFVQTDVAIKLLLECRIKTVVHCIIAIRYRERLGMMFRCRWFVWLVLVRLTANRVTQKS